MKKIYVLMAVMICAASMSFAQNTPVPANTDGWLHYDSDADPSGWDMVNKWGIGFPAGSFSGVLTKVHIYTNKEDYYPGYSITLHIIEGGENPDQGTELYSEELFPDWEPGWIEKTFVFPIHFNTSHNVWIVIECLGTVEHGIAGKTSDPATGAGGIGSLFFSNTTQSWTAATGYYKIRALFEEWDFPEDTFMSWDFENGDGGWHGEKADSRWTLGIGDNDEDFGSRSGMHNFKRTHHTTGDKDMLVSPVLDLSGYNDVRLGFWYSMRPWTGDLDTLRVYCRGSEEDEWHEIESYDIPEEGWTWENGIGLYDLTSTYQIGIECTDNHGKGIGLDDIYLTGIRLPDPDDSEPEGTQLTVYDRDDVSRDVPYYSFFLNNYTRAQYLLSKNALEPMKDMGIRAIRWYCGNEMSSFPTGYGDARFDVYMKEVENTAIFEFETKENNDIVYQGKIEPSRTSDDKILVTIVLDKPYVYHGGNLVIGCDNTVTGKFFMTWFKGQHVMGGSIAGYSNTGLDDVTVEYKNFVPKTTFYYGDPMGVEVVVEDQKSKDRCAQRQKVLIDGELYLMYEGKMYDVRGARTR